jgi:hypothetical protein
MCFSSNQVQHIGIQRREKPKPLLFEPVSEAHIILNRKSMNTIALLQQKQNW